jgi:hypothetical protein
MGVFFCKYSMSNKILIVSNKIVTEISIKKAKHRQKLFGFIGSMMRFKILVLLWFTFSF